MIYYFYAKYIAFKKDITEDINDFFCYFVKSQESNSLAIISISTTFM